MTSEAQTIPEDIFKRERRGSSHKEKGGSPEDARQEDVQMQHVMDIAPNGNKPTRITSENSPDKNAGLWLDDQVAKSKFSVITQVIDLTPALARVLLARNPENRKISPLVVENYARDMANGSWAFNGEPIIVSKDGVLNDGQHRCEAVISSNTTVSTIIVIGPERDSRVTVDQGKTRTVGDYLGMNGNVDAVALAAAANYIWQHTNHGFISTSANFRPTKSEVLAFVDGHPNVVQSLAAIPSKGSDAVGGRAILAFAHWTFSRVCGDETIVQLFLESLIKGSNLVPRSPILYARNRLMAERGRLKANEKAELIIRAWNASRRGDKVSNLPIKGGALPVVER